jgi:hypothetical protein
MEHQLTKDYVGAINDYKRFNIIYPPGVTILPGRRPKKRDYIFLVGFYHSFSDYLRLRYKADCHFNLVLHEYTAQIYCQCTQNIHHLVTEHLTGDSSAT